MMVKMPSFCAALLASLLMSTSTHAVTTAYTDHSAFLAAISSGVSNTLDFDSLAAGTTISSGDTLGGITFNYNFSGTSMVVTDGNQFGGGGPFDTTSGANFLGTDDLDLFLDDDDFTMAFGPSNAIGMFIITAEVPGFTLFDDDIQLNAGGATALLDVDAVQQTLSDGALVFFLGLVDDSATFGTASLDTPNSSGSFLYNIDDITVSAIPIPAAFWLFASGLAGLLAVRKRRVT